ncbi:MAG: hypothetical protein KGL39_13645 [Patescibacteria group bacterium]|nr:hypothetical protein [Patescibacteria group bacterium]
MIQLFITGANKVRTDYSSYVLPNGLKITDQINVASVCQITLANSDPLFAVPAQGDYVEIYSQKFDKWLFTGFITAQPAQVYLGQGNFGNAGVAWQYAITATSDDYLLNNKATPFIPAFVNQTQGSILATLANVLAPGYFDVTSHVASGDIVPYFQYDPSVSWSALAKQFGDASRYRYRCIQKTVYFQPYGDAAFGIAYDETGAQSKFDPRQLTMNVQNNPLLNDVVVIGQTAADYFANSYFVGDGFNTVFPLAFEMYRGDVNLLLQEDWSAATINTQNWVVVDPQQDFVPYQGSLNVLGGIGVGSSYIVGNNGLELGGTLFLQVGDFTITGPSSGIVGGLNTATPPTQANCFAGFLMASGGLSTNLTPLLNGTPTGPTITLENTDHTYQLLMEVMADADVRYTRAFRTRWGQEFGGLEQSSGGTIRWQVFDTDMTASIQQAEAASGTVGPIVLPPPISVMDYSTRVATMPAFAVYCPINSADLQLSFNSTVLAQPPQGFLQTSVGPVSGGVLTWQPRTLGFGLLGEQDATITPGQQQGLNSVLQFYNNDRPPEETLVWLRYRTAAPAIARVQDPISIAQQANIAGDDGHRGAVVSNISPAPRSDEEAEAAAQAKILDAETPLFQGTYSVSDYFWDSSGDYPITGRYFSVNAPNRNAANQQLLVTAVNTSVSEMFTETLMFQVSFGQDTILSKLLPSFQPLQNVLLPQDTAVSPPGQVLDEVGSIYTSDLQNVSLISVSSTGAVLDVGVTPVTGVEVRLSDLGWGQQSVIGKGGFIGRYINRQITVHRNQPNETFYLRMVNGAVTSRRTSVVQINAPTKPLPPAAASINGVTSANPVMTVVLPLDIQNVQGIEIRAADNVTVLFHRDWLTQSDLQFLLPPMTQRVMTFYVYIYNLIGGYSDPLVVTETYPTPGVTGLTVDEDSVALVWSPVNLPTSYQVAIEGQIFRQLNSVLSTVNVVASGGQVTLPLGLMDMLAQRTFVVMAFDQFGIGTGQSLAHVHAPQPVTLWNDPDTVAWVIAPSNPVTPPTPPGGGGGFGGTGGGGGGSDEYVKKSWEIYHRIPRSTL